MRKADTLIPCSIADQWGACIVSLNETLAVRKSHIFRDLSSEVTKSEKEKLACFAGLSLSETGQLLFF